ncbi:MAG: polyribonucleotide nucleotidyltransferase [Candidatus Taylorbacteria bacterium RIFCSPHIGHO2_01_FULL_45_63]|uniref:Polyribonucleotide nucleotidyltransferase n=1 Tax=Candidatus Taylorbacteria bacterium RIFCSPHIGHO2_02_FULL_45_35 TaxID=1802311 RepID=A0A1G2MSJ5_9BACT|nr:MAG: polyribonucleotide nucleotidyltransferase [Candidatus Taylorbacteria bacterium RIFCSPHIGHO2_01_FULL_45_63]OHA26877.1 MAG: polyribonucleotide nucleotidyltransferase [Candidatus Taylorbacteria bacterium RIFCSPHIGHO2_02_FULL_45_35]
MQKKEYSMHIGGKTLKAIFSDLADQANGSVMVNLGNTTILATAVMSKNPKDGEWFPLTVDYEERFYAAGQILGSRFMRREGRPTDEAILSGRIVDRTIRPLFNQKIRHDVQVVITVLSLGEDDPDTLAVLGASLALSTSDIPWNGPVSAVRLGHKKGGGGFIVNPTYNERNADDSELDLLVCGKENQINMIEVGGKEVGESVVEEGFARALIEINELEKFQRNIIAERSEAKHPIEIPEMPKEVSELFLREVGEKLQTAIFSGPGKEKIEILKDEWVERFKEERPDENPVFAKDYFAEQVDALLHREALENNRRPDGRKFDEIRPLFAQAGGVSPLLHGTGIFFRGGTHILSALTLGGPGDSQILDGMEVQMKKRFLHHYNFPPFSVGETGRIGGLNRRMTGHGALAEKALLPVLPSKEIFPYTIRIVSEAFASNGSTSMGSVCGSTLALMDAGVPITRPVAGIASGLMMESSKKYKVLTDIQGPEDEYGDMDFKVAGTSEGITAVQMDVKVLGVTVEILRDALAAAKKARLHILGVMEKEIAAPRADINPNAPKIIAIKILPTQIGLIIGTGGKTINEIMEKTGAEIDIEDDGTVFITGKNGSAEAAKVIIESMTREYKAGERFSGVVTRLMEFGAFVRIGPNTEGLVHVSEIAPFRVNKVSDVLKEGDQVPVVIKEIDEKKRINLSIKAADPHFIKPKK